MQSCFEKELRASPLCQHIVCLLLSLFRGKRFFKKNFEFLRNFNDPPLRRAENDR